ncbi:MAG: sigma-70 family RNA polymerase sigma factor [candidate division Zixibacteria bacterium]|nr:sigma-70 family RNA polymerase sigma factor [candidate division Zixibacteria bacterium]
MESKRPHKSKEIQEDDKSLIERILAGETDAFEGIIRDYGRLVNHIVYRMIPNISDQQDICQDVFVKIYQNLSSFRADAKLSTWIGRIATNRCLDFLGKKSLPLADEAFDKATESTVDLRKKPDDNAEHTEISGLLRDEINKLPIVYKTIITLYHLDENNYAEIGKILKMPEGTVKSYLFRARKMLRQQLSASYNQEELWQ